MRNAMFSLGLSGVVAATMTHGSAAEALNTLGLSAGIVGLYLEAFRLPSEDLQKTAFAPEPGQHSYRRWNADGTYDTIIWPYGHTSLEQQLLPYGNRIPPNVRS